MANWPAPAALTVTAPVAFGVTLVGCRSIVDGVRGVVVLWARAVSGVNRPEIDLSEIEGPAHSTDFDNEPPMKEFGNQ